MKPEGVRKQRQIRAYDDEWEIIRAFSQLVKSDRAKADAIMVDAGLIPTVPVDK